MAAKYLYDTLSAEQEAVVMVAVRTVPGVLMKLGLAKFRM